MGSSLSSSVSSSDPSSSSSSATAPPPTAPRSSSFLSFLSPRGQPFQPEAKDALQVVDDLSASLLPRELALYVVDLAEYWPLQVSQNQVHVIVRATSAQLSSTSLLISSPIPAAPSESPVRRIKITTESRDQGFSSFPEHHGTRNASSSWFELALIRPDPPIPSTGPREPFIPSTMTARSPSSAPPFHIIARQVLHYNVHGSYNFVTHAETLDRGSLIVDQAREGDRLVIYLCAQYPAWANECRMARIAVNYNAT